MSITREKLETLYNQMKDWCNNPLSDKFSDNGGKRIVVCPEWEDSFEVFEEWSLNNGYEDNLMINRINKTQDWEPSNCRWISKDDCRTANSSIGEIVSIEYEGKNYNLVGLAKATGIRYSTLVSRYKYGDRGERLIRPTSIHQKKGDNIGT